jgi:hypothetical protein
MIPDSAHPRYTSPLNTRGEFRDASWRKTGLAEIDSEHPFIA